MTDGKTTHVGFDDWVVKLNQMAVGQIPGIGSHEKAYLIVDNLDMSESCWIRILEQQQKHDYIQEELVKWIKKDILGPVNKLKY